MVNLVHERDYENVDQFARMEAAILAMQQMMVVSGESAQGARRKYP